MTKPLILDPTNADLTGNILIEASAGTGKTYTITTLVLRLLLGLTSEGVAIPIEKILIVTFTNAATAELKERIFRRIIECKKALIKPETVTDSEWLTLIEKIDNQKKQENRNNRENAIIQLITAERAIDQASIFTIHGFCQRILRQHALSAKLAFDLKLNSEMDSRFEQACQYFWRQNCYFFSEPLAQLALHYYGSPSLPDKLNAHYQTPMHLALIVQPFMRNPQWLSDPSILENIPELEQKLAPYFQLIKTIKTLWLEEYPTIEDRLEKADLNRRIYSSRNAPNWLNHVTNWAKNNHFFYSSNLERFGEQTLSEQTKEYGQSPIHPVFTYIDQLFELEKSLKIEETLKLFAAKKIYTEFSRLKEEAAEINFDDMIIRLSTILEESPTQLVAQIQKNYQAVMIDEFQDTDYYQFAIFKTLFFNQNALPFIMIGDPKQSIYKFRGADIYAYLSAKKLADKLYTLETNYRSSSSMITSVNQLFSQHSNPFLEQDIPFLKVKIPEQSQHLKLLWKDVEQKGITFLTLAGKVNQDQYREGLSEHCANEVISLLKKGYLVNGDEKTPLQEKDITFLVRGRKEANIMQKALLKRGLNAVYLSDRSNVFLSKMAFELYILLKSLLYPRDITLINQSFSSPLYGLSIEEYLALLRDSEPYERLLLERQKLRKKWAKFGVLGMLRYFLMQENRLARIKALNDGERFITDLFHLAELLQSKTFATKALLLTWFEEGLMQKEQSDIHQQRLESDFEAIKIMTIHKAKGLEFPIVFIPFALNYLHYRSATSYYDTSENRVKYSINPNEEEQKKIVYEEFSEAMRLLYVAVTRSKFHCRIGFAEELMPSRGTTQKRITPQTALGYLLELTEEASALPRVLLESHHIDKVDISLKEVCESYSMDHEKAMLIAATVKRPIRSLWRFTSFSHLSYRTEEDLFGPQKHFDEASIEADNEINPTFSAIIAFPKGVHTGNFIHELLETANVNQLYDNAFIQTALQSSILYESFKEDLPFWVDKTLQWLKQILQSPLDGASLTLENILKGDQHLKELEFLFPVNKVLTPTSVNRFIDQHRRQIKELTPSKSNHIRPATLTFEALKGLLKGFIDLIFYWEGKYYIVDYKTNFLGDYYEDYPNINIKEAIEEAYYDWQYLIYTVALVKYLRLQYPNFNYATDFGGIYYLFVRGMNGKDQNGCYFVKPDSEQINHLETLFDQ